MEKMRANFPGVRYVEDPTRSNSRDHSRRYEEAENARERSHTLRYERFGDPRGLSHTLREERVGDARGLSHTSREERVGDAKGLTQTFREERLGDVKGLSHTLRDELLGDIRERSHTLRHEQRDYERDRYFKDSRPPLPHRSDPHGFKQLEDILQNLSLHDRIGHARNRSKPQDYEPTVILKEHFQQPLRISPGINRHEQQEIYQDELDRLEVHERRKRRELAHLKSDPRHFPGPKFTLPSRYDWAGDVGDSSDPRREVLPVPPVPLPLIAEIPRYKGRNERRGDWVRDTQDAVVLERVPQYEKERRAVDGLRERGLAYLRECRREGRG